MKLVTFTSFKGGAGKSTALMAAVPGLLGADRRLALLEADENDTLALWRSNARESGTWDEARNAFAEIQALGMLHLYAARLREAGSIVARHIEIALREADVVSQHILDTLFEANSAETAHADQTA